MSFITLPTGAAISVLTYRYDNTRVGANINETVLTPSVVNTNDFGLLTQYAVDGYVYTEPLYVPNVIVPGQGTHNLVIIATEHDSVYAFDADGNPGTNGGLLWQTNFGVAALSQNQSAFGAEFCGNCYPDITPEVGVTGTPVIDPYTGTLYLDVFTQETTPSTTNFFHRIHALNITNGTEQPYSPVEVTASVPGTGRDSSGGVMTFSAKQSNERPALTLANGILYVAYAGYADTDPYHGWVIGFNATNLVQLTNYVFNSTPNATVDDFGERAGEGGVWMGGNGFCVDMSNNLYFATGNGSFDANTNGGDYAQSFIKLSTTNGLEVSDYFTPFNQLALSQADLDLGASGLILLPDEVGSTNHPHLLFGGSKPGTLFLTDRDNLGRYHSANGISGSNNIVQTIFGAFMWSSPAYFNHQLYIQGGNAPLQAYAITNGQITSTPASTAANSVGFVNGGPVISANGTNDGIVWVLNNAGGFGTEVLYAYAATNIATQLYNSSQLSRDIIGTGVKMTSPTVANGKVYVGSQYALSIYGLTSYISTPAISPNGSTFTNSVLVTITDATPDTAIYYTLDGTTPTSSSTLYKGPLLLTITANLQAVAIKSGAANSSVASASFINVAEAGNGSGLLGQYWANTSSAAFTNSSFIVPPTLVSTDAMVNFDWSSTGPDPSIGQTNFTVRWTGLVRPQYSETYTFTVISDDGARLWINGQLLIDNWTADSGTTTNSGSITLSAQQRYTIRMDYFQKTGNSVARLFWSSPSTTQSIVPQNQLESFTNSPPAVALTAPANGASYSGMATVTMGALADAPFNPIGKVDFYASGSLLGTLSNSPNAPLYTLTAPGLNPGSYSLTAVATDGSGLCSTSAPVSIIVNAGNGLPYGLTTNGLVTPFLHLPTVFTGPFPTLLSATGTFTDTSNRIPANGLIPYRPIVQQWSDAAVQSRYMAIPQNGGPMTPDEQIGFLPTNSWTFPVGTVFVKNLDLVVNETNPGVAPRRLETQLLVRDINGAAYGVAYKWRSDNSDADLIFTSLNEQILITNASGVRTQTWYYPSPADCLTCHTPPAGYVLGVNSRQLNANFSYPSTGNTDNQLRTLNRLGLLNPAFDEGTVSNLEQLSALTDSTAPLEERSRSYLDANCAQCHRPGGTGITFDARYDTPPVQQNITNYPAQNTLGIDNACIVKAQDVWRSTLILRMNTNDSSISMPPLARNVIDTNAVQVLADWVNSLPGFPALAPPLIIPNGGSFVSAVSVAVQAPDTNAAIYYTLDGSFPTANSYLYSGPFSLFTNAIVLASAFETNFDNSVSATAAFQVQPLYFTSEGFTNNVFQLTFYGSAGSNYVLEASTDLVNWIPISTNVAGTNILNWTDSQATSFPSRFYRVLRP